MGSNVKYTLEEAMKVFVDRNYRPLFSEYKNANHKLLAETQEGYKVFTSLSNIKSGKNPSPFGNNNPYTIENIKLYLKSNYSQYILLSTEFKSACRDKLLFYCNKHGEFKANWNSLQQNIGGCYECRNEKISSSKSFTLEIIKKKLKDIFPEIEILNDKYYSGCIIKCKCLKCENVWETKWGNLQQGNCCITCFRKYQSGENHPNWKGGISSLHDYLRSHIREWKIDSFKKSNYRCDITNSRENLIIHHHYNFSDILQETLDVLHLPIHSNIGDYTESELKMLREVCLSFHYQYGLGVCLTNSIHEEFHLKYGRKNNTYEQYKEFKMNKLSILNKLAS